MLMEGRSSVHRLRPMPCPKSSFWVSRTILGTSFPDLLFAKKNATTFWVLQTIVGTSFPDHLLAKMSFLSFADSVGNIIPWSSFGKKKLSFAHNIGNIIPWSSFGKKIARCPKTRIAFACGDHMQWIHQWEEPCRRSGKRRIHCLQWILLLLLHLLLVAMLLGLNNHVLLNSLLKGEVYIQLYICLIN